MTSRDVAALVDQARAHVAALGGDDPAGATGLVTDAAAAHQQLNGLLADALADLASEPPDDPATLRVRLEAVQELQRLSAGVAERHLVAGAHLWASVDAAVARLADLGPPSQLIAQGAGHAADAVGLERVVLSRVDDGWMTAEAVHAGDDDSAADLLEALRAEPVRLDYPLIEVEAVRRRRALLVTDPTADPRGRPAHADRLGWAPYVVAPVVLDGQAIGVFHADAADRELGPLDRDALWRYADGFARELERAVLRRRLQTQREQLRTVASWAESRTSELSDRAISLARDRDDGGDATDAARPADAGPALGELLTPREIEVLEHLAGGHTNAAIARALVVSEGTVKFHVKNILRKMQVTNRAEATARYLRAKLR